jgi:spore germination protein KA
MTSRGVAGLSLQDVDTLLSMLSRLGGRLDALLDALREHPAKPLDTYDANVRNAYKRIKAGLGVSDDVILRRLEVQSCAEPVLLAYIEGIVDTEQVDHGIIQRLLTTTDAPNRWGEVTFASGVATKETGWADILDDLVLGKTLIFAPGLPFVWALETVKYQARSIGRPQTELSVRGPQEAFNEVLSTQKSQLRRKIASPTLRFQDVTVGKLQRSKVSVAYLDGVVNTALVETIMARLHALDIDGIANATMVGGLVRDHPYSIFPTLRHTERVDVASWHLIQGEVAVMVDGDPFILLAPAPLASFYRTAMDYSSAWPDASFTRCIRFGGWILSLYLPALYVAFTQVNINLLPTQLLVIITGSHAGLPFSPLVEIVLMIGIIEILREAAVRLPQMLSTTIGTVGAIVVGTAIVRSGVVDNQIIVLMTLTALSLFTTPVYDLVGPWRIMAFSLLAGAAILGFLGVVLVTMVYIAVITDMESFGTPYFTPWAPFRITDWGDVLMRTPWIMSRTRWTSARPFDIVWRRPTSIDPPPHLLRARRTRDRC